MVVMQKRNDEQVQPEEEHQPQLLPLASLLGRLPVLRNIWKTSLSLETYQKASRYKVHFYLGDWIGLLDTVDPGSLEEERAHSKKSLQVLHVRWQLSYQMIRYQMITYICDHLISDCTYGIYRIRWSHGDILSDQPFLRLLIGVQGLRWVEHGWDHLKVKTFEAFMEIIVMAKQWYSVHQSKWYS